MDASGNELPAATFEDSSGSLTVRVLGEIQPPGTWFPEMVTAAELEACHLPPEAEGAVTIVAAKSTPTFNHLTPEQIKAMTCTEGATAVVTAATNALTQDVTTRMDAVQPIRGALILDMDQVGETRRQVKLTHTRNLC